MRDCSEGNEKTIPATSDRGAGTEMGASDRECGEIHSRVAAVAVS